MIATVSDRWTLTAGRWSGGLSRYHPRRRVAGQPTFRFPRRPSFFFRSSSSIPDGREFRNPVGFCSERFFERGVGLVAEIRPLPSADDRFTIGRVGPVSALPRLRSLRIGIALAYFTARALLPSLSLLLSRFHVRVVPAVPLFRDDRI